MKTCPCGSGLDYEECCHPYILGTKKVPTAEALMRSRYSAYVKDEIDYILKTHLLAEDETISEEETRKWAEESEWLGLEILKVKDGGINDTKGIVEFTVTYKQDGAKQSHHEISSFKKIDGEWLFEDGQVKPLTVVRQGPKIGRNDPCPCGSGKKYKKCCGKA